MNHYNRYLFHLLCLYHRRLNLYHLEYNQKLFKREKKV